MCYTKAVNDRPIQRVISHNIRIHVVFIVEILVRNPTPNQPFFRKSPSPSVPSPMGGNLPTQMVPSPLHTSQLVPSPQVTNIMRTGTSLDLNVVFIY